MSNTARFDWIGRGKSPTGLRQEARPAHLGSVDAERRHRPASAADCNAGAIDRPAPCRGIQRRIGRPGLLLGACLIYAGSACAAAASTPSPAPATTGVVVLSDRQLDSLTAASTVLVDLSAFAQGPTATTSTQGSAHSGQTTILPIAANPRAPAEARWHPTGPPVPAMVFIAAGRAAASGQSSAQCSANVELIGNFAYSQQTSSQTSLPPTAAAPMSVTCLCSAVAVSLLPH